ncbi:MAG: 3-dehydroquinate synthase [Nitrososphaerota archaeon]|nr:3-dehydroquinate synthase [Nitrososphaerota archaeon]
MLQSREKEIVLFATSSISRGTLSEAKRSGISRILTREASPIEESGLSFVLLSDRPGEGFASWVKIGGAQDVRRAVEAGSLDQSFVVVECSDWKIIPLENLVAEFRRMGHRLYAYASSREEIDTAFNVLEKGVDGVVIPQSALSFLPRATAFLATSFPLLLARVTRVVDAGVGDRACVDTTSKLQPGEGMLVGSKASFFFLVHGETLSSEYIPARPFRVNAGALHSYILSSDRKTRYLSELEPPDRVAIIDGLGNPREASVGRVKIERRPMVLIEATVDGEAGAVILQKAETVRLVRSDRTPVSVTDVKAGDEVLVHTEVVKARHFGGEVDESIQEK